MFFVLSKILAFLTQPFFYVVVLFVLSFVLKKDYLKRRFRKWSLIILLLFSNSFIADEVVRLWEVNTKHVDELEVYDYGILLGGMMNGYDKEMERINFHGGVDRLMQTLMLYKAGKIKKIVITSGAGTIVNRDVLEAQVIGDYLIDIGFRKNDLILESQSDNTHENAVKTKALLQELNNGDIKNKNILLITSGLHMKRASACFYKEGLICDTFTTNRKSGLRKFTLDHLLLPNIGAMGSWNALAHEIIGYAIYFLMGYI